ncbi:MAG: hypothetical protein L6420_00335 [Elusimicrobia bacterium]|nr:hypothetical protein [Elusimicrobiota bacterium]
MNKFHWFANFFFLIKRFGFSSDEPKYFPKLNHFLIFKKATNSFPEPNAPEDCSLSQSFAILKWSNELYSYNYHRDIAGGIGFFAEKALL